MAESHMVSGLKQFRVEYLRSLHELYERLHEIETEIEVKETLIDHIDGVLKVAAPDLDLETVKPLRFRRVPQQKALVSGSQTIPEGRPSIASCAYHVLKESNIPMTIDEVIEQAIKFRPDADPENFKQCVRVFLSNKVKAEVLRADDGKRGQRRYEIIR